MSVEQMPVMEKKEEKENEGEKIRTLRPIVEQIGGHWQVDGVKGPQTDQETVFAFYVPNEETPVEGQDRPAKKEAYIQEWIKSLGYEPEEDLDDEWNFPTPGKYRRFLEPPKNEEYLFRIAQKRVESQEETEVKKAA